MKRKIMEIKVVENIKMKEISMVRRVSLRRKKGVESLTNYRLWHCRKKMRNKVEINRNKKFKHFCLNFFAEKSARLNKYIFSKSVQIYFLYYISKDFFFTQKFKYFILET